MIAKSNNRRSESRKRYLRENPDQHPWKKSDKFMSKPCEYLKNKLRDANISFVEEYSPLEERHYSVDICFPDEMIAIEVNGNQHYNNDGLLTPYYQERHDMIEAAGWKVIELHYSTVYSIDILSILNFDYRNKDYTDFISKNKRRPRKCSKYTSKEYHQKVRDAHKEAAQPLIELVEKSNIDFSKFGWVSKVAPIIGKHTQKVNIWMKKYMPDFYEKECFKKG